MQVATETEPSIWKYSATHYWHFDCTKIIASLFELTPAHTRKLWIKYVWWHIFSSKKATLTIHKNRQLSWKSILPKAIGVINRNLRFFVHGASDTKSFTVSFIFPQPSISNSAVPLSPPHWLLILHTFSILPWILY